jgi:Synaptobrevin/Regulated-SNARE-like domain
MADEEYGRTMPFVYLKDVSEEFFRMYKDRDTEIGSYGEFSRVLANKTVEFSGGTENNTVAQIQQGLTEMKDVMRGNIDKVLKRGDEIDQLIDKTENFSTQSDSFRSQSRRVKQNICWAALKARLFVILLVLVCTTLLWPWRGLAWVVLSVVYVSLSCR